MKDFFSGATLTIMEQGLGNHKQEPVLKYAGKFNELLKMYFDKGFHIAKAKVNFMVYWKDEEKQAW